MFAAGAAWAQSLCAHPASGTEPAAASSVATPTKQNKPAVAPKHSQVDTNAAKPSSRLKAAPEASADPPYRLSHGPHRLDPYQNAVTPPPSASER